MLIRCPSCAQTLGFVCAEHLSIKHRGREVIAEWAAVVAIRCERCGTLWQRRDGAGAVPTINATEPTA